MPTNSFNPRFTNYDSLAAYLTGQGSTFKKVLPLYTIGSDANDSNIIGHWGYNSNNLIAPFGEIDLSKVTPSRFGTVASVSGSVITLTAGHNLPASFSGLQWDTSAAAELFYGTPSTVTANVFTASNTAGIAAGDVVYDVQSSEFSIGGTTRNVNILIGQTYFAGGLLVSSGSALLRGIPMAAFNWRMQATVAITNATPTDGHFVGFGAYWDANRSFGGGQTQVSAAKKYVNFSASPTAPTLGTAADLIGAGLTWIIERVCIAPFGYYVSTYEMSAVSKGANSNTLIANSSSPVCPLIIAKAGASEAISLLVRQFQCR